MIHEATSTITSQGYYARAGTGSMVEENWARKTGRKEFDRGSKPNSGNGQGPARPKAS